jgi:hypothetical protein
MICVHIVVWLFQVRLMPSLDSDELIDFCEFVWCLQFMAGVVYREAGILFM